MIYRARLSRILLRFGGTFFCRMVVYIFLVFDRFIREIQ